MVEADDPTEWILKVVYDENGNQLYRLVEADDPTEWILKGPTSRNGMSAFVLLKQTIQQSGY